MSMIAWVVVVTAVAGVGGTGLGGVVGAVFKRDSSRIVSLLLSFAGGVMLAVVCFDLILGAIFPENGPAGGVNIFVVILSLVVGYGVIYLLNYLIDRSTNHEVEHIDKSHPKTADDLDELIHADHWEEHKLHNEEHLKEKTHHEKHPGEHHESSSAAQLFMAGLVMACAIALHNLPEGIVIGASYAGENQSQAMGGAGLVMAIIIGLHNIPEGMAVSVPLIAGGMHKAKAMLVTALSGVPTIIGAVIGYYLGMVGPVWLSVSMSFAAGAMLYVVLGELLPEAILMWRSKLPALSTLVGILVGLVIIYA